jgi:hypothetical protein
LALATQDLQERPIFQVEELDFATIEVNQHYTSFVVEVQADDRFVHWDVFNLDQPPPASC